LRQTARRRWLWLVEDFKTEQCRFNADLAAALIPAGEAAVAPRTGSN
jgi:hypothetical protein